MERTESRKLLWDVLSIPTVNGEGGEVELAAFFARVFQRHGIGAEVERMDNGANVIARMAGREPGLLALNGHLDTVPYGDREKWRSDPAVPREQDGRLYGRGASDMKGGLAAMAAALCGLADRGETPRRDVVFLGTWDEEKYGRGAQMAVSNKTLGKPDLLLIGEPTGGSLGLAQKGCLWLRVTAQGRTSHGAYPWEGVNAVELTFELCRELADFVVGHSHPLLGSATAIISMAQGGIAPNMVPDTCAMMVDIRTVPGLSISHILDKARELSQRIFLERKLTVSFEPVNERRAIETAQTHPETVFVQKCVQQVTGENPPVTGINYFTDASILASDSLPVILYGPGRPELAHKPDEWISLTEFDKAVDVYREILIR